MLLSKLKPYLLQILIVFVLVYIQVQVDLMLPDYMANIINNGIIESNQDVVVAEGEQMLLVSFVGAVTTIAAGYLTSKIATGYARDVRESVFQKAQNFSLTEFDKFSASSLITRATNDIQQVQMIVFFSLRMVVSAPIMGVGAIMKALDTAPSISWIIIAAVAILFVIIGFVFVIAVPKFNLLQKLIDKLNLVSRENITGIKVIRAFNKEKFQEEKFARTNSELMKVNLFTNRIQTSIQPIMMFLMSSITVAIIWFGAKYIELGNLNIGEMMAFMQYAMQVLMSFMMLSMMLIILPRAFISLKRISEVLKSKTLIKDPKSPKQFDEYKKGLIEFKNVTFSYPGSDTPVLKNISFVAETGKTTAIIGSTGSGKSTLINLIPRLYDISGGEILVDGVNIKQVKQSDLRDKLGFVPQKNIIFSGTIASNLKYGNESASQEEIIHGAKISQAYEFIEKLEGQFNSPVSQMGINLSGGQKQRLSIGRAIIKSPEIYIFDDSFSALDFKTDAALRKALEEKTQGSSVIIITQRVGTAMHADRIIVLDEGQVVGIGTHEELLMNSEVYKEIAESQLTKSDLEKIK